jgi:hypothetical protein
VIGIALLAAAQAMPPAPAENGLQPPMTFACRVSGPTGPADIEGRISRFYLKVVPGTGIMAIPDSGGYRDHVVVEIKPSPLRGLAGRYDMEARFPLETDKMILTLPGTAGSSAYTLTASPVKFGVGYQAFTKLQVERAGATWAGACTTSLPKPEARP